MARAKGSGTGGGGSNTAWRHCSFCGRGPTTGQGPQENPQENRRPTPLGAVLVMNQQCTNNQGFSGELHKPNELSDAPGLSRRLPLRFARSKNTLSSLSLLRPGESCSCALPEIDSQGAGSPRPSARLDLQLRQRDAGTPENLHPLYGKSSAPDLQLGGNATLHHRWTLPRYPERNRRLRSYS